MVDAEPGEALERREEGRSFLLNRSQLLFLGVGAILFLAGAATLSWGAAKAAIRSSEARRAEAEILASRDRVVGELVPALERELELARKHAGKIVPLAWVRLEGIDAGTVKVLASHDVREVRTTGVGSYSIYFKKHLEIDDYLVLVGSAGVHRVQLQDRKYVALKISSYRTGLPEAGPVTVVVVDPRAYLEEAADPDPRDGAD